MIFSENRHNLLKSVDSFYKALPVIYCCCYTLLFVNDNNWLAQLVLYTS